MTQRSFRWAIGILALASGAWAPLGAATAGDCPVGEDARVWTLPLRPQPGEPLSIVAVGIDAPVDRILVTDPAGTARPFPGDPEGGPPWSLFGTLSRPLAGTYRIEAMRGGRVAACTRIRVGAEESRRASGEWGPAEQALYSVWVERLFDAPPEQSLSFNSLAPVLRDPGRNFLYGYLGIGEDKGLPAVPDCADLPYFLRAYFAWKLGLPMAYRACSRGSRSSAPRCEAPIVETAFVRAPVPQSVFRDLSRRIMDKVHSGTARTALADESTDLYPVALDRASLWPGSVYADPYGHTLVVTKWVPQTSTAGGLLLAVDAQPDNSVARKRFWEGNFLFAQAPSAGPGFKAFRPLIRVGGGLKPLSNGSLRGAGGTPAYSGEQARLDPDDFYARMERAINPRGQDPEAAYRSTLAALMEQLQTRVASVDRGEQYMRKPGSGVVPMPEGPGIFETTGPWEDYATPSRDMRVLIALNVLAALPERVRRHPELYVLRGEDPASAARRIEGLHRRSLADASIEYTRSDGSPWQLTLGDIYDRRRALEVAYNPNDCVERRWGATPGSREYSACGRQAPKDQQARMEEYRTWFHETRRPPR